MRLIDADALVARMATVYTDTDLRAHYTEVMRAIMDQPTVDAVPVVRCKDCKWYCQRTGCCNRNAGIWTDDDFCSYAEWRGYDAVN